jgi:hypothetical protein
VILLPLGHALGVTSALVEMETPAGRLLVARPAEDWDDFPVEVVARHLFGTRWTPETSRCDPGILSAAYRAIREAGGGCIIELSPYNGPIWEIPCG